MSHRLTADYITRRIEHAGATLRCLRIKHPSTQLAQMQFGPNTQRHSLHLTPSARDITLMDEAFKWIPLIPNAVKRRLVGLRAEFDPIKERHVFSWRACGEAIGVSHVSAKVWHAQSIALLTAALSGIDALSLSGCNILPRHIGSELCTSLPA
jgi:hypothetical protein